MYDNEIKKDAELFLTHLLISDSAKLINFTNRVSKIEKQTATQLSTVQQHSNEWSHFMVLSLESKVRKLCNTQRVTLGVKRLENALTNVGRKQNFAVSMEINLQYLFGRAIVLSEEL